MIHGLTDIFHHTIQIPHDIIIPVAQNSKTLGFQICRALSVRLLLIRMMATVEFDDDQSRRAAEIHNIWTDRMLPSEFQTLKLPGSKALPQQMLHIGLIPSQQPCKVTLTQVPRLHIPLTLPSPHRGEGFGEALHSFPLEGRGVL
jgi:hypothetical protein